jgi:hypothetical protein
MSLLSFLNNYRLREDDVDKREIIGDREFPERCYACGENIEQMSNSGANTKGQFVVHREDSKMVKAIYDTASVGLCSNCTEQVGTIIDHWKAFEPVFNQVEEK